MTAPGWGWKEYHGNKRPRAVLGLSLHLLTLWFFSVAKWMNSSRLTEYQGVSLLAPEGFHKIVDDLTRSVPTKPPVSLDMLWSYDSCPENLYFAAGMHTYLRPDSTTRRRMATMPNKEKRITFTLIASKDDPPYRASEYQASLREVERALRTLDKHISVLAFFQESVDASTFLKGGFTIVQSVATAAVPAIGAWLLGRAGRKIRLKIGDVEAEAHSMAEVEELLKLADKVRPRVTE